MSSPIERLSPELFDTVLGHITTPHDLSTLCLVSKNIYHRAVPKLYHYFSYHGLKHDSKSLKKFLKTVIWRPDLAALIKEVDLREWGDCPKLEDYVGMPGYEEEVWGDGSEQDHGDGGDGCESASETNSDHENDDESDQTDADDEDEHDDSEPSSSDKKDSDADEEEDLEFAGTPLRPLAKDRGLTVKEILKREVEIASLTGRSMLADYHTAITEDGEEILIPLLLTYLPNIQTLYMVVPDEYWEEPKPIMDLLTDTEKVREYQVLQKLEAVYLCSALHIGSKGHREYEMEFQFLLPFLSIPSLRSMYTLSIHTFDDPYGNFQHLDLSPLKSTSNITFLAWDEADITWMDAVKGIAIPKALEGFRWSQKFECFSPGSCYAPFQSEIGKALMQHMDSLRALDLDVRHRYCDGEGHPGNPFGTVEALRRTYPGAEDNRMPRDGFLIGSLRGFEKLTMLSIDATSLCGHQKWSPASTMMIDALPPNLQELNLRLSVCEAVEGQPADFENQLWLEHVHDLMDRAGDRLPSLQCVRILVLDLDQSIQDDSLIMRIIDERLLDASNRANIDYSWTIVALDQETPVPYFRDQNEARNPGRDF